MIRAVDPDPGGKTFRKKQKNARKLEVIVFLFNNLNKFGPAPRLLTFQQYLLFVFYNSRKIFIRLFITNFFKGGSGTALEKQLDPDPQKMNADPQPCT